MVCKRDIEKKRIKDRDMRDAGIQMMNFKQLRRSEMTTEQGTKRKYKRIVEAKGKGKEKQEE